MKKIGIFGGTFAPIHNGHIRIALKFKEEFCLDKLLIIPASIPPHKEQPKGDSTHHRLEMLKSVFDTEEYKNKGIEISEYELNKPGKSYTVDTLKHYYRDDAELYLLCGTDMLLSFHQWKSVEEIAKLANIVFTRRESSTPELDIQIEKQIKFLSHEYSLRISELKIPALELSSTYIRENIENDISDLVPPEVLKYINNNNLYRG